MGQGPICSTHILFSLGKVDVAKYYTRGIFFSGIMGADVAVIDHVST